jgi:hypothetical protein
VECKKDAWLQIGCRNGEGKGPERIAVPGIKKMDYKKRRKRVKRNICSLQQDDTILTYNNNDAFWT